MGNRSRWRVSPPRRPLDDTGGLSPYTFEGEMVQLGSFASAAARRQGVMGVVARAFVWFLLLMTLSVVIALVASVVNALSL
jgi:hypothetical protein